jgi:hypothetical protein
MKRATATGKKVIHLDGLLKRLADAGVTNVDREKFVESPQLRAALLLFHGVKPAAEADVHRDEMRKEAASLLAKAIPLLADDLKSYLILGFALGPEDADLQMAEREHQTLMALLSRAAELLEPAREPKSDPRRRGGRREERHLDPMVRHLANLWEEHAGPGSFKGQSAKAFVAEFVQALDPSRLSEVKKAVERVIAERKTKQSGTPVPRIRTDFGRKKLAAKNR